MLARYDAGRGALVVNVGILVRTAGTAAPAAGPAGLLRPSIDAPSSQGQIVSVWLLHVVSFSGQYVSLTGQTVST